MPVKSIQTAFFIICVSGYAFSEEQLDWLSWRGPHGNGSADYGSYPSQFGGTNYLWKAELPGKGCSTPVVLNRKIYLTAPVRGSDALLCFDFDGVGKWQTVFGEEKAGKHRNGSK